MLLMLTCFLAFAQQEEREIEKKLPSLKGKERLEALVKLSDYYSHNNKQKYFAYATEAGALAEKYGDVFLSINALVHNGDALAANNEYDKAKVVFLRALLIAESKDIEKGRTEIFNKIAGVYISLANYDSAMVWYQKALSLLKNSKNKLQLGKTYSSIALVYWRYGANKDAHDYFTLALEVYDELGNDSLRSRSLNSLGSVHSRWGNYSRAFEYFNQSLNLAKKIQDNEQITKVTINLGFVYYSLKNYENAKQSFLAGRELAKKNQYRAMIAYAELSLGMISNQLKDYSEAIRAYGESAKIYEQLNDITSLGQALEGLGKGYSNIKSFDKAEDVFKKALELSLKAKNEFSLSQLYLSYGNMLFEQGRYNEADRMLHESLLLAGKNGFIEHLKTGHELLSRLHRSKGEINEALLHYKKYISLKDTTNSAKVSNDIVNLQINSAIEREANENRILRIENELQEAELSNLNTVIVSLVIFGIALGFGLFAFYRMTQLRRKNAERTLNSNQALNELNSKLEEQNQLITKTIHTRDTLFSIIAHDLKSPFSAMLGYTEMLVEDIEELDSEEIKAYSKHINQSSGSLFNLVNNLFEWTRSQNESIKLSPSSLSAHSVILNAIETYKTLTNSKQITTEINVDESVEVFADEYTLTTVIRNLYSNAIKFTPKYGTITITAQCIGHETLISVSDSGIGMTEEQIARLNESDSRTSTLGTEGEKGTGLGLMVCKEFVTKNNGVLTIGSELGRGSTFTIRLPKEQQIL